MIFIDGIIEHQSIGLNGCLIVQFAGSGFICQVPISHPQIEMVKVGSRVRAYLCQNGMDVLLLKLNPEPPYRGFETSVTINIK